jgi:DNA-binding NarL/FixJ family response regulator
VVAETIALSVMASNDRQPLRAFPPLPIDTLLASSGVLRSKLQAALDELHGPLPAGYETVFAAAVNAIRELEIVLPHLAVDSVAGANDTGQTEASQHNIHFSVREREILRLMCGGYRNGEIAKQLNYGVGTIKAHIRAILQRLGASDRTEAAVIAVKKGLV